MAEKVIQSIDRIGLEWSECAAGTSLIQATDNRCTEHHSDIFLNTVHIRLQPLHGCLSIAKGQGHEIGRHSMWLH